MSVAESPAAAGRKHAVRPLDAACLAVLAAAHAPFLYDYFAELWRSPHYDFFPLALGGAGYLAWRDRARLRPVDDAAPHPALPAFVAGALLLASAVLLQSPWLAVVSSVWHLGAIAWRIGGPAAAGTLVPAGLMCLTILRLPLGLDKLLVQSLQTITARASSAVLDVAGVLHIRAGNVIEIPGRRLLVEEACSGVNSLFAATACTLFFVLWRRIGKAQAVLLLMTIPFWTVTANSARVVLTALLRYRWDIAADEGRLHDALGMGVFAVAMLLILSTAAGFELIRRLFGGLPRDDEEPEPVVESAPRGAPPRLVPLAFGVFAAVLCALEVPGGLARIDDHRAWMKLTDMASLGEAVLPAAVGDYRREKYERVARSAGAALGEISQTWYYDGPKSRTAASLDYPYFGWHELTECYIAQGWQIDSREFKTLADGTTLVEVVMRKAERAEFGHLLFLVCDPAGVPLPASKTLRVSPFDEWYERGRMVVNVVRGTRGPEHRPTAQFQVFTEAYAPLNDDARRAALADLYARLWHELRPQVARAAEVRP
jgi:exosortase